jgi:hypothetical protein
LKKCILIFLSFQLLISCKNSDKLDYKNRHEDDVYEVVCNHPMGHIIRIHLVKSEWERATGYRNSVWRFTDVNNIEVKTHGPCYTDSTMIVTGDE